MSELRTQVIDIIANTLKADASVRQVLESSEPGLKIDAWDSVKHVEIVVALEDHFDIDIPAEWIAKLNHVDRIVDYLGSQEG